MSWICPKYKNKNKSSIYDETLRGHFGLTPVTFQQDQPPAHKYSDGGVFIIVAGAWKNPLIELGATNDIVLPNGM